MYVYYLLTCLSIILSGFVLFYLCVFYYVKTRVPFGIYMYWPYSLETIITGEAYRRFEATELDWLFSITRFNTLDTYYLICIPFHEY